MPTYQYKCDKCGPMEIFHGMMEDDYIVCPECKIKGLTKLISSGGAVIMANREANQYSDILQAKFWRDKNGVRHKVGPGDGHSGSGTVSKQISTPAEIQAVKKKDAREGRRQRSQLQKTRADTFNKEQLKNL